MNDPRMLQHWPSDRRKRRAATTEAAERAEVANIPCGRGLELLHQAWEEFGEMRVKGDVILEDERHIAAELLRSTSGREMCEPTAAAPYRRPAGAATRANAGQPVDAGEPGRGALLLHTLPTIRPALQVDGERGHTPMQGSGMGSLLE
jgi:hypothetical protein